MFKEGQNEYCLVSSLKLVNKVLIEPTHETVALNMKMAASERSDETAHVHSIVIAFAASILSLQVQMFQ